MSTPSHVLVPGSPVYVNADGLENAKGHIVEFRGYYGAVVHVSEGIDSPEDRLFPYEELSAEPK